MPDDTINIYFESSFFTAASGSEPVTIAFTTKEADSIGLRDMPIVAQFQPPSSGTESIEVDLFSPTSTSGFDDVVLAYETDTVISGTEVCLVDYATPTTASGTPNEIDKEFKYFTGYPPISGTRDVRTAYIAGDDYASSTNISHSYWGWYSTSTVLDRITNYTAGTPGSGTTDARSYFTASQPSAMSSGVQQVYNELTLAGYPIEFHPNNYTYRFDLVTGIEGDTQGPKLEATVISGAFIGTPFNLVAGATASGYVKHDIVCGLVDLTSYSFDSQVISGTISYYYHDMVCGASGTQGYGFDVDLLSLKISNFSLEIDEYDYASSAVCVDVTDDVHNVVTSGTYFIIDGAVTSGTFIPITDGYTMCYDSVDDFSSFIGSTTFTVHAANDNGDILERSFYLTSGYIVEYDNRTHDYGYSSQVVVQAFAENLASCPKTGADAYFFTTVPKPPRDLGASIVGVPWSEKDLSASITPTTDTIYFYGKEFTIEVRARDLAGNIMEPYTFEFRIEDEPE